MRDAMRRDFSQAMLAPDGIFIITVSWPGAGRRSSNPPTSRSCSSRCPPGHGRLLRLGIISIRSPIFAGC